MVFRSLLIILLLIFFSPSSGIGQHSFNPTEKTLRLISLAARYEDEYHRKYHEALAAAQKHNWIIKQEMPDGSTMEIQSLRYDGMPLYFITTNLNAAKTVSTYPLWPGKISGFDLSGSNVQIGLWDAGAVRSAHQELLGRVTQMDGVTSLNNHSTHVAGTLVATGIDSNARGMAYQAELLAYDWNNDNAEMALAASNGLLLSNHSYGLTVGWYYTGSFWFWFGDISISETEDYLFGFYDERSQAFDEIAYNAPYYLIVRAAGNERAQTGPSPGEGHYYWNGSGWRWSTAYREPDGGIDGYDSMDPEAIAKNILTVGAVSDIPGGYLQPSDVVLTTFSSMGPTDDGRIKPDLVANGTGLYSCSSSSNTSYTSISGTSQAAPNVTGSLALLQQMYTERHNGTPLKAATLKGLVIHTADEAGPFEGPDYAYGWGLLNSWTAAEVIADEEQGWEHHLIQEITLYEGNEYSIQVNCPGTSPLKATICWTDPPATPNSPALNSREHMLINDLDLRIEYQGMVHYPWVLDPDNPNNAATRADNNTDNVEQVFISNPSPGMYTIKVQHKNTLQNGSQDFALIMSGASFTQELTLLSPNGSEEWIVGTAQEITWSSINIPGPVQLEYSLDGGNSWNIIALNLENDGQYTWMVPNRISTQCRVRVSYSTNPNINDESDQDFSIINIPALTNVYITKEQNNLLLNWTGVIGASYYKIYRDTSALFSPDFTNLIATISDTFYQDTDDDLFNNIIGDTSKNYFYVIRAANDSTESDNSPRVGEYDFFLSSTISQGLNPVAMCLWDNTIHLASELMVRIPGCYSLSYWNTLTQQYVEYHSSNPLTDFNIYEGYPYFVRVTTDTIFTLIGRLSNPSFNLITTNGTDFNAISLPLSMVNVADAAELTNLIANCNSVAYWDIKKQRFEQYSPVFPHTNFRVKPGMPYFVNMTGNTIWP
ncbi:MAG: hypothetical protein Kow0042_14030 [Calditrichia bacterium]